LSKFFHMEVDLFIPCFIDQLYPKTAWNTLRVLERAGCKVHYNPEQTCCGQPAYNSGYFDEARTLAVKFLKDFRGKRPIVSPGASCSGYVRDGFADLFEETSGEYQEYIHRKGNVIELTDFLVNHLGVTNLGASFPHKITYHDACSALRGYGIHDEPRQLLQNVDGLELVEMEETTECCGFGGTFAVKHSAISTVMTQNKVENALKTGAEYIVSTEASCLMNISGYIKRQSLPVKVLHIADVLASF